MSHTRSDKEFCSLFDTACARVGMRAFRSEFERILPPAWKTIRHQIINSSALFLLVGKELVNMQEKSLQDLEVGRTLEVHSELDCL